MNRTYFAAAALAVWAVLATALPVAAKGKKIDPKADRYLKEMSEYLASLKTFSFQADSMFDEVKDNGQKIQLGNRRMVTVKRPNNVMAVTTGDTVNRKFYYDGKTITLYDRAKNAYATFKAADTIPAMLDEVFEKLGHSEPMAELLFPDPYKTFTEHVQSGTYVGLHHVGKVKCHHLAFRQKTIDWQIWIQDSDEPLPRKIVITYKRDAGGPQFTGLLSRWEVHPKLTSDTFLFKPPEGSEKVKLAVLLGAGSAKKQEDDE
jgi:hypothetical protein